MVRPLEELVRAPLSIVIPTLNAAVDLPATLAALTEGLDTGVIRELIISDGGSTDETLKIADAAGADIVTGSAGRGGQLARGVAASGGPWILALHADTALSPGWAQGVLAHMRDAPDRAGYFRLSLRAPGMAPRLVAGWANFRSRHFGLPYGDQGLVISRGLYEDVGGYADLPLMEDVALARALKGQLSPLDAVAETSAARYLREGFLRRGGKNLVLCARFLLGADPRRLAELYRR